jgi:hypothetical protein
MSFFPPTKPGPVAKLSVTVTDPGTTHQNSEGFRITYKVPKPERASNLSAPELVVGRAGNLDQVRMSPEGGFFHAYPVDTPK